jgi:hypothetical protein
MTGPEASEYRVIALKREPSVVVLAHLHDFPRLTLSLKIKKGVLAVGEYRSAATAVIYLDRRLGGLRLVGGTLGLPPRYGYGGNQNEGGKECGSPETPMDSHG